MIPWQSPLTDNIVVTNLKSHKYSVVNTSSQHSFGFAVSGVITVLKIELFIKAKEKKLPC